MRVLTQDRLRRPRRPLFVLVWFLPAWLLLGVGRLMIGRVPFRRMARHLGTHRGLDAALPLLSPAQDRRARLVGRTIAAAARRTPWRSDCFPQAITARVLLGVNGLPCAVFFGVRRISAEKGVAMAAHAWVRSGPVPVCGGLAEVQFTTVSIFTYEPGREQ